jgi:SnoaL-like domain
MTRPGSLKYIGLAWLLIGGILISDSVAAQQQSEMDAVKAANQAFYAALSAGDVAAMQKVWSSDSDIQNIGPRSKAVAVGWNSIKTSRRRGMRFQNSKSQ